MSFISTEQRKELKQFTELEKLDKYVEEQRISKGGLMKVAYNDNTRGVDSALPIDLWSKLEPYGGTYYFVMDYQNNSHGNLIHLGEKILGIQSNWQEILTAQII